VSTLTFTLKDLKNQQPCHSVDLLYSKLPDNIGDETPISLLTETDNSASDILWLIGEGITGLSDDEIKTISVKVAIFSAESVLNIFEEKYPDDDRPRKAIEAAKNYLENPTKAAAAAADAAYAAAAEIKQYLLTLLKEYES